MSSPLSSPVPTFHLRGDHYRMGRQHGEQARPLRPAILRAMDAFAARLAGLHPDTTFEALVQETARLLDAVDPQTTALLRGLSDGLSIGFERLRAYNLAPFLLDILTSRSGRAAPGVSRVEGCTTWAATGQSTIDGAPLLVKNRDYRLEHLPLQVLVRADPEVGYRYLFVTSAGSPGVFVAGMNEAGLALVDTHVASPDVGPGLPTYALSMHTLERYSDVRAAMDYIRSVPCLGRNNLLLADAGGDIVLLEIAHRHQAIIEARDGLLVNTNHYQSDALRGLFVDTEPPSLRGNSQARWQLVQTALTRAAGRIDLSLARQLMATHAGPLASVCRHPTPVSDGCTIASMIFQPRQREMLFVHGQPCSPVAVTRVGVQGARSG